ncbi:MAG: ATP-binding protein, partial [Pseudomonadota bacterium]
GDILQSVPKSDKERREKLAELNREVGTDLVSRALEDVKATYADVADLRPFLSAVTDDMIDNIALFLPEQQEGEQLVRQSIETQRNPKFRRYMTNVVVTNGASAPDCDTCAVPIIDEVNPNFGNLIGRIEHVAQMGALLTDFLLLKPGALHRANGGYLLLDARKMLLSPFAWEALKRAMKSREIRIEAPQETTGFMSTQTIDPEPIPLDVKVILFGDRQLYYTLANADPDFARLFQVQADFEDAIPRTEENNQAYGRLIASIIERHKLLHVT